LSREQILEAAAQIFSEKGYHAASMRDIADAVRLRKPSLYHHVTSKQEILFTLLDQALEILIDGLQVVVDMDMPPDEKLREAMREYLRILTENKELSAVLLLEHRSLEAEFHTRHIPARDRFEGMWRQLVQEGVDAGIFHCQDIAMATRALLGVLNWTITWYNPDGPSKANAIADQYANLFLRGLLVRVSND
jgi:AcrR family transcriptional regulator